MYKLMTRSARRRADLVGAIRAVQVSRHTFARAMRPPAPLGFLG